MIGNILALTEETTKFSIEKKWAVVDAAFFFRTVSFMKKIVKTNGFFLRKRLTVDDLCDWSVHNFVAFIAPPLGPRKKQKQFGFMCHPLLLFIPVGTMLRHVWHSSSYRIMQYSWLTFFFFFLLLLEPGCIMYSYYGGV